MKSKKNNKSHFFERLASKVTLATGSTAAIVIAFGSVVLWGVLGPVFHYSEDLQQSHSIDEAEDKSELKKDIEKDVRKKVGHQKVKGKKPSTNKSGIA